MLIIGEESSFWKYPFWWYNVTRFVLPLNFISPNEKTPDIYLDSALSSVPINTQHWSPSLGKSV
jgi:hypothetical protein